VEAGGARTLERYQSGGANHAALDHNQATAKISEAMRERTLGTSTHELNRILQAAECAHEEMQHATLPHSQNERAFGSWSEDSSRACTPLSVQKLESQHQVRGTAASSDSIGDHRIISLEHALEDMCNHALQRENALLGELCRMEQAYDHKLALTRKLTLSKFTHCSHGF